MREVWVGLTPDWWLCLFLLARLTSSIRSTETDTDWLRRLRYQFWSNVYITVDTGEQGPTQQAGPPVQNELYFHNDYNVAQCSCQEKAHPSEDCEQPKNNSALTSLLHHSLSLSLSLLFLDTFILDKCFTIVRNVDSSHPRMSTVLIDWPTFWPAP